MEPEHTPLEPPTNRFQKLQTVTPLSKYLAMALFVALPFIGGWIGYSLAPHKALEMLIENKVPTTPITSQSEETIATATIDMVSYLIRYDGDKIELIRGIEVVQTIPWDTSFRSFYTDDESLFITNWDINFDHHLDLGILTSLGYGGVNRFYDFYTFDPATYSLIKVADFDEPKDFAVSSVSNPGLDIESRIITSEMKSGQNWLQKEYIFDGESYVSDSEWINRYGVQKEEEYTSSKSNIELGTEDLKLLQKNIDARNASKDFPELTTSIKAKPVGTYNGRLVEEIYWCNDVCPNNGIMLLAYKGIGADTCREIDGFRVHKQGRGHEYVGCSPIANKYSD